MVWGHKQMLGNHQLSKHPTFSARNNEKGFVFKTLLSFRLTLLT